MLSDFKNVDCNFSTISEGLLVRIMLGRRRQEQRLRRVEERKNLGGGEFVALASVLSILFRWVICDFDNFRNRVKLADTI